MHLLHKGFIKKYMCWQAYRESYVPHDTMVERMVGLASSFSNVHEVLDDNSNISYRIMIMDTMRMNQGHTS
jgi:hypothetical protein